MQQILDAAARKRRELADLLDSLTPEQLEHPSLCDGWSCRVVAGHLYAAQLGGKGAFLFAFVRSGFNPDRTNDVVSRAAAERPVHEIAEAFRRRADEVVKVPVVGVNGPLSDLLIHTADIRVPLGLPYEPAPEDVALSLDFLAGGAPGFVKKKWVQGLLLAPTDLGRTWGAGAEVRGRAIDIVLAITGRRVALENLDGPGVELLASRL